MNKNVILSLRAMFDVNKPIIYIEDFDFVRVDEIINAAASGWDVSEWNPGVGEISFCAYKPYGESGVVGKKDSANDKRLQDFLRDIYNPAYDIRRTDGSKRKDFEKPQVYVLREIQDYIDEPEIKTLLALIAQRHLYEEGFDRFIVISSSVRKVPAEIEKYVTYLDTWPMPAEGQEGRTEYETQIDRILDEHCKAIQYEMPTEDKKLLKQQLTGMTPFDMDRVIDMAMSSNGTLNKEDTQLLQMQKKTMVKQSGVLELIDTPEKLESIGGMEHLKRYLTQKSEIYKDIVGAQEYGVSVPKGVFIVGMPGCGKSLCAKVSAAVFNCPLLKLDMGSLMGKYVGESEANLRKAIKIAEAVAPSVLWIDEIEKAFSGVNSDDNGLLRRMFGYFLTWMQDKTSSVYVIATANNAANLPPELKRKGRFDEIFCVNLPTQEEREAIFKVHLNKRKRAAWGKVDVAAMASEYARKTEGFNGADIESVINESVEELFRERKKGGDLKTIIGRKVEETISISKSCKKQIESMQKEFKESSFKDASSGRLTGGGK